MSVNSLCSIDNQISIWMLSINFVTLSIIELGFTNVNAHVLYSSYFETIMQAYNYHGETLLAQDKCGEAIGCLQESQKCEQDILIVIITMLK